MSSKQSSPLLGLIYSNLSTPLSLQGFPALLESWVPPVLAPWLGDSPSVWRCTALLPGAGPGRALSSTALSLTGLESPDHFDPAQGGLITPKPAGGALPHPFSKAPGPPKEQWPGFSLHLPLRYQLFPSPSSSPPVSAFRYSRRLEEGNWPLK